MSIGFRLFFGVVAGIGAAAGACVGMAIGDRIVNRRRYRLTFESQSKIRKQYEDYCKEHINDDPFGIDFRPRGMFEVYKG